MALLGSTTCQVSRFFQSWETIATMLRTSSGSLFQSPRGRWLSLLIKTGARPLARNSRAKLVADELVLLTAAAPEPRELVLRADDLLGAQAIPVVLAEEPHAGEPAGPLEPVEVVVSSTAGRGRSSGVTSKWLASQSMPVAEAGVEAPLAAVVDRLALEVLETSDIASSP